jgi:hypothetical protein
MGVLLFPRPDGEHSSIGALNMFPKSADLLSIDTPPPAATSSAFD